MKQIGLVPFLALLALAGDLAMRSAPSWPQFRGPNGQGVAERDRPPTEFGPNTNLLWKVEAAGGVSSPCIWGDQIFLTAFSAGKLETLALDRHDGRVRWRRVAPVEKIYKTTESSSPAAASPTTDGKNVYVYFPSFGLLAYGLDGRESWRKPMPVPNSAYTASASPILVGNRLIQNCDQEEGQSFLLAVDSQSGRTLWLTPRPDFATGYATPVAWKRHGVEEIVVAGSLRVVGYSVSDGKEKWSARGLEATAVCPSPALGDGRLYAMSFTARDSNPTPFTEWMRPRDKDADGRISRTEAPELIDSKGFDQLDLNKDGFITEAEWDESMARHGRGEPGIFAVRAPGTGDVTDTHVLWKRQRGVASVASPLFYLGRVYVVQDGGRVTCYDAATGVPIYEQERLGTESAFHASPVAADKRIFFSSTSGTVTVVAVGSTLKVLSRNALSEAIIATPAIADHKLYVRTRGHLWAFGKHEGKY